MLTIREEIKKGEIKSDGTYNVKVRFTQVGKVKRLLSSLFVIVDGVQILKVRYMPLEYTGFGYYTFGKQELQVDDVEFIQL